MARWHSCNVFDPGSQIRRLWQFNAGGGKFNLLRTESKLPSEALPPLSFASAESAVPEAEMLSTTWIVRRSFTCRARVSSANPFIHPHD